MSGHGRRSAVAALAAAAVFAALAAAASAQGPAFPSGVLVNAALPASYASPLCGSRLTACAAGTLGHDSAAEPAPSTVGGFTEISLTRFFDTPDGAEGAVPLGGAPPKYTPAGWGAPGINGTPYVAAFFPSTGNWTVTIHGLPITFLIPAEGVGIRSTFDLNDPVSIPVPPGHYRAVWILGNGIGGGAGDVLLEAHYSNGKTLPYLFNFTDWCSPGQLVPGEFPADVMPYLQQAGGSGSTAKTVVAYEGCGGLYAVVVPISSAGTLESISIPGSVTNLLSDTDGGAQNDFITAISLQQ